MENKKCKRCKRILPEGYKRKYCTNCIDEKIDIIKKTSKGVLSIGTLVVTALIGTKVPFVSKIIDPNKK